MGQKLGFPSILNVQDLFPQYAIDLGVMKNQILIHLFKKFEQLAYNSVDLITVNSKGNADFIRKYSDIDFSKVVVIENWIDENEVQPGDKVNDFSRHYKISNKFIVSFVGTLGFAQDVNVIMKTANITRNYDIYYLIVGDGVRKKELLNLKEKYNLKKVIALPPVKKINIQKFFIHQIYL